MVADKGTLELLFQNERNNFLLELYLFSIDGRKLGVRKMVGLTRESVYFCKSNTRELLSPFALSNILHGRTIALEANVLVYFILYSKSG